MTPTRSTGTHRRGESADTRSTAVSIALSVFVVAGAVFLLWFYSPIWLSHLLKAGLIVGVALLSSIPRVSVGTTPVSASLGVGLLTLSLLLPDSTNHWNRAAAPR